MFVMRPASIALAAVSLLLSYPGAAQNVPQATPAPNGKAAAPASIPVLPGTEVVGEPNAFSSPAPAGYGASSSTTGSVVDLPSVDLPGSVTTITQSVIADQHAVSMDDVIRDIGGAVKAEDLERPDALYLRGFLADSTSFRKNGFLDPTYTPRDFANVERIEILKGPESVLYGAGQPDGTINLITKKPLDHPFDRTSVELGTYGFQRYTIDTTGPVDGNRNLLYRLNVAYQNSGGFRGDYYDQRTFLSPVLTRVFGSGTTLTWEGEYVNDQRRSDSGVPSVNGQLILPTNLFLGEPSTDTAQFDDYRQTLTYNHLLDKNWALKVGAYSLFYDAPSTTTYPVAFIGPTALGPDTFLRSQQTINPFSEQYQSIIANVARKFDAHTIKQNFVAGIETGWFSSSHFVASASSPQNPATSLAIDATSPIYGNTLTGLPNPATAATFDSRFRKDDYGIYAQDLLKYQTHWKGMIGGRYDYAQTFFNRSFEPVFGPTQTNQTFSQVSPKVGLIYEQVPEKLSYYTTYGSSFDPPDGGPRQTTAPLMPERGQIWEAGVKGKPLSALIVTAAAFRITKENVTVDDTNTFPITTQQVGTERSQGAELGAQGQITQRWSITANWAYTATHQTDSTNPSINNQTILGVPFNSENLWTRYNVLQSKTQTFGLALGVTHVGQRLGDYVIPAFNLPAYTRWDSGIYYKRGSLDFSAYLENLFNTTYYTGAISQYQVFPGAPLNGRVQASYKF